MYFPQIIDKIRKSSGWRVHTEFWEGALVTYRESRVWQDICRITILVRLPSSSLIREFTNFRNTDVLWFSNTSRIRYRSRIPKYRFRVTVCRTRSYFSRRQASPDLALDHRHNPRYILQNIELKDHVIRDHKN